MKNIRGEEQPLVELLFKSIKFLDWLCSWIIITIYCLKISPPFLSQNFYLELLILFFTGP